MAIDSALLELLCCPVDKVPLRQATAEELKRLNHAIHGGEARQVDGTTRLQQLEGALIRSDGERIYPIDDGLPVLLADQALSGQLLEADA